MIKVNGNEINNADNLTLLDFLNREGYKTDFIAVECNGKIIPKINYKDKLLLDGDSLEVVSFVGGG